VCSIASIASQPYDADMGSETFSFLADSILFDDAYLASGFAGVDDARLRQELDAYRAFCLAHIDDLLREVYACESVTKIFAGVRAPITFDLLKQMAFYADQFVLDDPLFSEGYRGTSEGTAMNEYFGMKRDEGLGRRVAEAARLVKRLTPFVAANYAKVLPVSSLFEVHGGVPLRASENRFDDVLPGPLMEFFRGQAEVHCMRREGATFIEVPDQSPSRYISVRFKNDEMEYVRLYQLWANEVVSFDEATRIAKFAMTMPDEPPDQAYFDAWVHQSINQTAIAVHDEIRTEFELARQLKAAYFTKSPFAFDVLERVTNKNVQMQRPTSTLLNTELPFLADVDATTLMRIREEDADAFARFRGHLDKHLRAIASTEPAKRAAKIDDVAAEMRNDADEIGRVVERARKKFTGQGTLALAALSASVKTAGLSLPVAATAAAAAYAAYQDYRSKVEAPAYFLWRVLKN
jgi:hypothetical protein